MTNPKFFMGRPQRFKEICSIYPPTVNEVVDNDMYALYYKLLTISSYDLMEEYVSKNEPIPNDLLTPFEYLLNLSYNSAEMMLLVRQAIQFFTHENCYLLPDQKCIIFVDLESNEAENIKSIEDLRMIKEEDFFSFQNLIRESVGDETEKPVDPNENPRVARMKAKARYRDKIKAKKSKGLNLGSFLASICCMNLGINPLNIGELSYAAVTTLTRYYQNKEEYELDIRSLLAGADSKKIHPNHWMRNLED